MAKLPSYTVNTFNQELLQCVAISFFIRNPQATQDDFSDYIENNFFERKDDDKILDGVGAEYDIKNNLGVFNTSSDMGIGWIKSSVDIAKFLISKLNLNNQYKVYHQKSEFGRMIKEECIDRIVTDLDLEKFSKKPDIYNPTDIWIVRESKVDTIKRRLREKIIDAPPGMVTKNYLSNKHTYKSIIGTFFRTKDLYQISLKKASPSGNVKYRMIGSLYGIPSQDIDPYTKFISILDDIIKEGSEQKFNQFISDLVLLRKINYSDEVLQPNVTFTLRYGQLDVSNQVLGENENWKLDTPGNTFNMQKIGGTAWSGGFNFNGIHLALKNYTQYMPIFLEMKKLRYESFEELYSKLFPGKQVPQNVKNILLRKDEIIYKKGDLEKLKTSLGNEGNYKQFLVEAIKKLSHPYRGEKSLYGISALGSMDIQESGISKLKDEQDAISLSINPIKKGDTVITYTDKINYKSITARGSSFNNIRKNDTVFIRKINPNGSETPATTTKTRVKSVNIRKKTITLTKPISSGGGGNLVAVIFNPVQVNILSDNKLRSVDVKILEQKFSKLQPFWMFMRGGRKRLRDFLKKQIVLTIYGMVSKKGGKIFEHNIAEGNTIGAQLKTKNALEKYIIPQFAIVGD
jgi:hypothetical protein